MTNKDEMKKYFLADVREFVESTIINCDKMGMEKGNKYYVNHESLYNCLKMAKTRFEVADAKTLAEKELIEFLYLDFYQIHLRAMIEQLKESESTFDAINKKHKSEELREVRVSLLMLGSKIIFLNEYKQQEEIQQSKLN